MGTSWPPVFQNAVPVMVSSGFARVWERMNERTRDICSAALSQPHVIVDTVKEWQPVARELPPRLPHLIHLLVLEQWGESAERAPLTAAAKRTRRVFYLRSGSAGGRVIQERRCCAGMQQRRLC